MPRSNRPRRGGRPADDEEGLDLSRVLGGFRHVETKRDGAWNVQPQSAATAVKTYVCPGCGLEIGTGVAHVVAWRADHLFGDDEALAARRHWHTHCWRIRS